VSTLVSYGNNDKAALRAGMGLRAASSAASMAAIARAYARCRTRLVNVAKLQKFHSRNRRSDSSSYKYASTVWQFFRIYSKNSTNISLKCSFLNGLSSAVELNEIIASSVLCYNNWYYWQ